MRRRLLTLIAPWPRCAMPRVPAAARAAILTRPCKVYGLETPERIAPPAGAACPPCGPRGGALRNDRPDDTEMIRSWCARCIMCIWDIIIQSPLSTTVCARAAVSSHQQETNARQMARAGGSGVPSSASPGSLEAASRLDLVSGRVGLRTRGARPFHSVVCRRRETGGGALPPRARAPTLRCLG